MLPCKGEVHFNDIHIDTAGEAASGMQDEIALPHLPLARFRNTFAIDLSKVANRALADEMDNDGKGGWTDQGPDADMRELKPGEQSFGGVPFTVLSPPKSVVVLKSVNGAKGDLPARVTIPVALQADDLFFLHAAAWFSDGSQFKYVVHYADGKDAGDSGQHAEHGGLDSAKPVTRFPAERETFSTVAQTVNMLRFGHGQRISHGSLGPPLLDRRQVEIKSIEFVGDGKWVRSCWESPECRSGSCWATHVRQASARRQGRQLHVFGP